MKTLSVSSLLAMIGPVPRRSGQAGKFGGVAHSRPRCERGLPDNPVPVEAMSCNS